MAVEVAIGSSAMPPPMPSPSASPPLSVPATARFKGVFGLRSSTGPEEWAYGLYGTVRRGFDSATGALSALAQLGNGGGGGGTASPPPPASSTASPPPPASSPPPSPVPPLDDMTALERLDATLSSTYSWRRWPASNTIDGRLSTVCASKWQANAWLSVQVPAGSAVDYVAIYNRADRRQYAEWLGQFEIYVGNAAGDTGLAGSIKCAGPVSAPWTQGKPTPFVIACPRGTTGTHVTLKQVGRARYLTVLEMEAYTNRRQRQGRARTAGGSAQLNTPTAQAVGAEGDPPGQAAELANTSHPEMPVDQDSAYYATTELEPEMAAAQGMPLTSDGHDAATQSNSNDIDGITRALVIAVGVTAVAFFVLLAYACRLRRHLHNRTPKAVNIECVAAEMPPEAAKTRASVSGDVA